MWASTALEGFQRAEKNQLFHLTSNVLTLQHTCIYG